MQILKTLTNIADEYKCVQKTFKNHINKHPVLKENIKRGLQTPKFQKLIYETLGYPPCVNKSDYDNV